jgi:hypothetical protein
MVAAFIGCGGSGDSTRTTSTDSGGGGTQGGDATSYYLGFVTTCGDDDGAVVGIQVFDEATGDRVESGNSDGSGEYCSFTGFGEDDSLRIEWWDLGSDTCIMYVTGISVGTDPSWFDADTCPTWASNHVGGSCTTWDATSGCWGS